jgi:hypothetical protein
MDSAQRQRSGLEQDGCASETLVRAAEGREVQTLGPAQNHSFSSIGKLGQVAR